MNVLNDDIIMRVASPKDKVEGPFMIIWKTCNWAIVALNYDGNPRLGIRWFIGENGVQQSRGMATWFILPEEICGSVIAGLPLHPKKKKTIEDFLIGAIQGDKLKSIII